MIILDTDHVSLWLRGNSMVKTKGLLFPENIAITIITVQEVFNGWTGRLNNLPDQSNLPAEYENLWQAVGLFGVFQS